MEPYDAFWHVLGLLAPALGIGVFGSLLAKMIWRSALQGVGWRRLCATVSGSAAVVLLAGLVAFGRDGRMATYVLTVFAAALSLRWMFRRSKSH